MVVVHQDLVAQELKLFGQVVVEPLTLEQVVPRSRIEF
jgi:hypothetical protein